MKKSKYPRWKPDESPKPWRNTKQEKSAPAKGKKEQVTDCRKEFLRKFRSLTYSRGPFDVWSDFITMSACAISNVCDKGNYAERERIYLSTIGKYKQADHLVFPELLALTTLALEENSEQDFLGSMFMNLNLGNEHNGQFFTPYHVSQLMADVTIVDIVSEIKSKGYISIHDPCCGAGAMLIASANVAKERLEKEGLNFQNHIFIAAQDIDQTVAQMCYIQLSLLGIPGFVKVGNSLVNPIVPNDSTENYWFTPMYFSDVWHTRRTITSFMNLIEGVDNEKV